MNRCFLRRTARGRESISCSCVAEESQQVHRFRQVLIRLLLLLSLFGSGVLNIGCQLDLSVKDLANQHDGGEGAAPPEQPLKLLLSSTQLTTYTGYSYVEIAVDWPRKIAYISSREPGICAEVIDFSDERNPVIIGTFGSAQDFVTLGNTCLGLRLFDNNTRLVLSHVDGDDVEVWDLGSDPSQLVFSRMASVSTWEPRRIAQAIDNGGGNYELYVAARDGVRKILFNSGTNAISVSLSVTAGDYNNDAVLVGNSFLATAGQDHGDPARLYDISDFSEDYTFPLDNGGSSMLWSATASADGSKAFIGGQVAAFLSYSGGSVTLTHRFEDSRIFRDATIENVKGTDRLYGVTNGENGLYVFDLSDINNPVLLQHSIPVADLPGSLYGISVDPLSEKALTISNKGYFLVLDLRAMPEATFQFPTY